MTARPRHLAPLPPYDWEVDPDWPDTEAEIDVATGARILLALALAATAGAATATWWVTTR